MGRGRDNAVQPPREAKRVHGKAWAVMAASLAGLPLALIATTPSPVAASPAPVTIAYVTDVTGAGAAQTASSPAAFRGPHRIAKRTRWRSRPQACSARRR